MIKKILAQSSLSKLLNTGEVFLLRKLLERHRLRLMQKLRQLKQKR